MTPEEKFYALRDAGLIHHDRDLLVLFDDLDADDPAFAKNARALKPALFHVDARQGYRDELAAVTRPNRTPTAPKEGFNALTATDREFEDELRRLGVSTSTYGAGANRFKRGR